MEVGSWDAVCAAIKDALSMADQNIRTELSERLDAYRVAEPGAWRHMYVNGVGSGQLHGLLDAIEMGINDTTPAEPTPRFPDIHVNFERGQPGGNVFSIIGRVRTALARAGHAGYATDFQRDAMDSHSYADVLNMVRVLVTVDDEGEWEDEEEMRRLVREDR